MVEHQIWKPDRYGTDVDGLRTAIMGYSHHSEDDVDSPSLTNETLRSVVNGERIAFFTRIASYFGQTNTAFWPTVSFFNFLPDRIGNGSQRFGPGSDDQKAAGHKRFLRLMREIRPERLLVFTTQGWEQLPEFTGVRNAHRAFIPETDVEYGSYETDASEEVVAFKFRHPQGASGAKMDRDVRAVRAFDRSALRELR